MATIVNASINLSKIDQSKIYEGKNGKYLTVSIVLNDETRYGNNVSISEAQTKEEREAKSEKNYLGNGKVVWTDGNVTLAEREEAATESFDSSSNDSGLPF